MKIRFANVMNRTDSINLFIYCFFSDFYYDFIRKLHIENMKTISQGTISMSRKSNNNNVDRICDNKRTGRTLKLEKES